MYGHASDVQAVHSLLPRLARCRTVADVGGAAVDMITRGLAAPICGVVSMDSSGRLGELSLRGASDGDFEEWDGQWRRADRAFTAMLAKGTPVHVGQVYRPGELERLPIYTEYGLRIRAAHFMAAPVFGSRGTLAGALL